MRIPSKRVVLPGLIAAALAAQSRAQDHPKKPSSLADVLGSLQRAGSESSTHLFESLMGEQSIGYLVSTLTPVSAGSAAGFDYRAESVMKMPNGVRIEGLITARLTAHFEPRSIVLRREVIMPDGRRESTVEQTSVGETEIELKREVTGTPTATKRVQRPNSPFVFGTEFLLQRVNFDLHPSFVIEELDPQEGRIITQTFSVSRKADKSLVLTSKKNDGSIGFVFQVDETGQLTSWAESPLPVVFQRCTKERMDELKALVQKK